MKSLTNKKHIEENMVHLFIIVKKVHLIIYLNYYHFIFCFHIDRYKEIITCIWKKVLFLLFLWVKVGYHKIVVKKTKYYFIFILAFLMKNINLKWKPTVETFFYWRPVRPAYWHTSSCWTGHNGLGFREEPS